MAMRPRCILRRRILLTDYYRDSVGAAIIRRGFFNRGRLRHHTPPRTPAVLTSGVIYPARLNHLRRGSVVT